MIDVLSKPISAAKFTWNIVRSIGPFLISQSDSVSEAYARHQGRLAGVAVGKELFVKEIQTLCDIKKVLLEKFIAASSEERIRIRQDLEEVGASLRQLSIGIQALNYLPPPAPEPPPSTPPPPTTDSQPEVSAHWIDKFSELARAHNEPWREDLLARALAAESSIPGTVSPRALWLIGTLEEQAFNSFATLLDLASFIGGGLMIPSYQAFDTKLIPQCAVGEDCSIGNLVYRLDEVGLFADPISTTRTVANGGQFLAAYNNSQFIIQCTGADLSIGGVIPTSLGTSLASFYRPKPNPLGKEIFDAWIAGLDKSKFSIRQR